MRRWALRICVFVLLGAIVNIAVAWIIALGMGAVPIRDGFYREMANEEANAYWRRQAPADWHSAVLVEGNATHSWAFGREEILVIADDAARERLVATGQDDVGWPALTMRCDSFFVVQNRVEHVQTRWAWRLDVDWLRSRTVPLRPTLPGFAINTVFYAAVMWLLFAAPFALRLRMRIKRGLCPKCAYDLRGHGRSADATACPECGALR